MGWDSNPRKGLTFGGFQDRCIKPLCHPSGDLQALSRAGRDTSASVMPVQEFSVAYAWVGTKNVKNLHFFTKLA